MEDLKRMDVEKSLSHDILHVLKNGKDIDDVSIAIESSQSLLSHCEAECLLTRHELEVYEKKIEAVKKMIREVEQESVSDDDGRELAEQLQVERSLQQELREIEDKHASSKELAASVDKHNTDLQRKQKDALRSSDLLSMCASVTNIIPDFDDKSRISGYILNGSKSKCERFDLEPSISPVELCNKLWKM
ncbi:hypothetical protein ZOSMA_61G00290 [Zostera marina]|uniref:Kinetochore protein Spc24 n=1 Tax=Zostera marina TaxID=29655 RepID=A0A0K9NTD4_ZOSMR|nr:hypothetical protein ZOSMA_61G00290 [Zostera marina]